MTAEQLMLYFNLALTALIVLGALRGFVQGFKKSLFKLIKEILFWVIFYVTADLFANFILKSPLVFNFAIQYLPVEGNPADLVELVQLLLVQNAGVSPDANIASSISFTFAIVSIVLKIVYLLLYVTVFNLLYNIVWGIIWSVFVNRKKIEIQYKDKKLRNGKIKKVKTKVDLRKAANGPRILGFVFGGFRSMIGVTLVISLLMSIISIFPKDFINSYGEDSNVTASNQMQMSSEDKNTLEQALEGLEVYVEFVADLENSPYVKLVRSIKSDETTLDLVLFDTVMNGNYEEYNIKTRESLSAIVEIGYDVAIIVDECQQPDGSLDLNKVDFDKIGELVEKVTEIDLLMEAIPVVVELGLSMESVTTSLPVPIDDELRETLVSIDWRNDVVALANVVRTLGEVDNLSEVMENPLTLLSKENEHVIHDIITQLADLTLVTKVLPAAVEYAMEMDEVKELIGDATVDLSNIVWEEELVQIAEIYSVFLTLSSDITSLLFQEDLEIGDMIDGVNLNALNDLILKVFELGVMEELFEPIMDIVVSKIEDESIREMLNFDIDNYEDWAKEFTIVIDIVKELLADGNPFENGVDVSIIKNINPETISKSKILSQVLISAIVDASNGEGIFAGDGAQELTEFIDVPTSLKDKESPAWHNQYDEEGNLVSKGQLHKTLEALQTIMPDDPKKELKVNDTYELSYTTSGVQDAPVVWASSNPAIASVDQNGVVTAVAPGHAVIIASSLNGKVKDMEDIIVRGEEAVPVQYVLIEGKPVYEIVIGIGQQNREFLSATTNLDATNQILTWESLNEDIVKVSEDGAIEGLKVGTGIVKVTSNADATKFALCNVTVLETLPEEIEVNKESLVGYPDKVFYVDARINGSKEGLKYSIADETVASVDETGFVTLLKEGETSLTISKGTVKKVVSILVLDESTPTKIEISEGSVGFDVNSILSSLDEEDIDKITSSDVLTRSLSKILLNSFEDDGANGIHIPLSVIEKDGEAEYISKEEIKNILDILLEVDLSVVLEGGDVTNLLEDLDDDSVDAILESKVLSAFLSSTVSSIGEGMIVVPSSAYKEGEVDYCYKHPTTEVKYIKNSEVKALVKMLKDYDLLSGEDISIPLSEDNSELVDLIESSDILRATLSKFVIDMSNGSDAVIVVPDQAIETIDGCKLLKADEFEAVLDVLYDLGFEEISTSLTLDLTVGNLKNASESINNSMVLRATVAKFITPVEEIVIPDQAKEVGVYTVNNEEIEVIKKTELTNLIIVLDKLLGSDATFESIELNLTVGDIQDALHEVENSTILMATISDLAVGLDAVVVPDEATDNLSYTVDNNKIKVLYDYELEALVNTLVTLLGKDTSVDNISLDITIGKLKDSLEDIKESSILKATLTDKIVELDVVVVPDQAVDKEHYSIDGNKIPVIYNDELDSLIKTMVTLIGEEKTVENISLDITLGKLELSLEDIKESTILKATLTDKVVDLDAIIVPDQATDRENYTVNSEMVPVIYDVELEGLVKSMVTLIGADKTVDNITLDITLGKLQLALTNIKKSSILKATLTDKVVGLDAVIVPDQALDNENYTANSIDISVIYDTELEGLVNTMVTLVGADKTVENISLDITLGKLELSLEDIKTSTILKATITDKVVGLDAVVVPDQATDREHYTLESAMVPVILDDELDGLIKTMVTLIGADKTVDNISLNITLGKLELSLEDIKASTILKATITDKVVGLDTVVVPDQATNRINYTVENAMVPVILDDELDGLIKTMVKLIGADKTVDNIAFDITLGKLQLSLEDIKASTILKATITEKVSGIDAVIVPDQATDRVNYTVESAMVPVILNGELDGLINTMATLLGTEKSINEIAFDIKVGQLSDSIESIKASTILMASMSNKIIPLEGIIVPDNVSDRTTYSVDDAKIPVLFEDELENLILALEVILGEDANINSIEFDLTVGQLNDAVSYINGSGILRTTVAEKILPLTQIIIPDQVVENYSYYKGSSYYPVLTTDELKSLVEALNELLGTSTKLNNIQLNLTVGKLSDTADKINLSNILRATISDKIYKIGDLIKPDQVLVSGFSKGSAALNVLTTNELKALMNALSVLLGETTKVDEIELNLTVGDLKKSVSSINKSGVLKTTIGNKIIPNTDLVVPDEAVDSLSYSNGSTKRPALEDLELEALAAALAELLDEGESVDGLSLNLTVGDLSDAITPINKSKIIRATVSNKINKVSDLVKPDEAYATGEFYKDGIEIDVLTTDELKGLVGALESLLGRNAELNTLSLSLKVKDLYNSVSAINESLVLRSTISDKIDDNDNLEIPTDAIDVEQYFVNNVEIDILSKDELLHLAKALVNIVGEESKLDEISIPTNIFTSLLTEADDDPSKNKLEQSLESVIIWNKVSNMIVNLSGSFIVVPADAKVGGTTVAKDRITVEEINNLMKALKVLDVGSIENIELEVTFIFDLDDEIKDPVTGNTELTSTTIALEKSKIMMASIPTLFKTGIESAYEEDISISFDDVELKGELNAEGTAYVAEGELVRLFRAVRAANTIKEENYELGDLTGKITDPNSKVSEINALFLTINASEVLKPTVAQVLAALVQQPGLNGAVFEDAQITLILSQAAAGNDLKNYAVQKAASNPMSYQSYMNAMADYTTLIAASTTVTEVEANYDAAIAAIDAI